MHRTIMSCFPQINSNSQRKYFDVLYRIEKDFKLLRTYILVQSRIKPNWSLLPNRYVLRVNNGEKGIEILKIDNNFITISNGSLLKFRHCCTPMKRRTSIMNGKKIYKKTPLLTEENQIKWFKRKGDQHGFHISSNLDQKNQLNLRIINQDLVQGIKIINKKIKRLSFNSITFDGLLKVVDKIKFITALHTGIGRGKSFGFGLITIELPYN